MSAEHVVGEPGMYRSLADWSRLLEILDQEKQALAGNDMELLQRIINDKEKLCMKIRAARVEPVGVRQGDSTTAREMRSLVQQCQKLNTSNHLLLMHLQQHTQQVLDILAGGTTLPALYTASGHTEQRATGKLLMEA
jgi:flagellar biosynthesis/type III secretory pathway chaperone